MYIMAFQATRIYSRTLLLTRNVFHTQENICNYRGWSHRTPSKVFLPQDDGTLKEDKIIDISESFENKNYVKEIQKAKQTTKEAYLYTGNVNFKTKNKNTHVKTLSDDKKLFDFEELDAITHDPQNIKPLNPQAVQSKKAKSTDFAKRHTTANSSLKGKKEPHEDVPPREPESIFNDDGKLRYEKLDYNDTKISNLIIKLKSRKTRGRCGQVMLEGWRLVAEGLQAGCELQTLLFSRISDLERVQPFMPRAGPRICKMPYKEMQMWSNLETSPGIVGIFKTPNSHKIKVSNEVLPINVICDNIREPGNLGSILRTALGVGCQSVMLTIGCADIWDSKVLRSAAGAHFRLPIETDVAWSQIEQKISRNSSVFIADHNSNENLMDKFTVNKRQNDEEDNEDLLLPLSIPVLPYYSVDYSKFSSTTLVIGGETMGISESCYRFANKRSGLRVNVPTIRGVDSLNSGTALAVIAFEVKRQILMSFAAKHSPNEESLILQNQISV